MEINCTKEHPLIVILPDSETVIIDEGVINAGFQRIPYDSGSLYADHSETILLPMFSAFYVHAKNERRYIDLTQRRSKSLSSIQRKRTASETEERRKAQCVMSAFICK